MEKKLIKQIRRLCEKQYRKGFEHGYDACDEDLMSRQEVTLFRMKWGEEGYKQIRNPFSNRPYPKNYPDLLEAECWMVDMEELCRLLTKHKYEVDDPILWRKEGNVLSDPCPFCNEQHKHGEGEGWRIAHCNNSVGKQQYILQEYKSLDFGDLFTIGEDAAKDRIHRQDNTHLPSQ